MRKNKAAKNLPNAAKIFKKAQNQKAKKTATNLKRAQGQKPKAARKLREAQNQRHQQETFPMTVP